MSLINNSIVRGALAGAIATVPMTAVMAKIFENLPTRDRLRPLPPGEITENVEIQAGVAGDLSMKQHRNLTVASHYGYGALCGALYMLTFNRLRWKPAVKGVSYGLGVWGVSYLGWLPALGLFPAAWRESKQRNGMMIAAHVVWGFSLARFALKDTKTLFTDALAGVTSHSKTSRWMQDALT